MGLRPLLPPIDPFPRGPAVSKPDPSITADLLSSLPVKKAETHAETHLPALKKDHGMGPKGTKTNARSTEKGAVQGHTRSSNRAK